MQPVALSPQQRESALDAMATTELDVLVVGGGVVGAGAALDAVTRGLDVGLVEARDFASGTSSRSSKLIHGGLRYLEMLDFALVAEALQERGLLLERLAPHLVRPVPFLYPLRSTGAGSGCTPGPGVALYDTLAVLSGPARGLPRAPAPDPPAAPCGSPRRCARTRWSARCSTTTPRSTTPGTPCYLVRTAAAYGAHVANRAPRGRLPARGRAGRRRAGAGPRVGPPSSRSGPGRW